MNRIYRLIWKSGRTTPQVVSELGRAPRKGCTTDRREHQARRLLVLAVALALGWVLEAETPVFAVTVLSSKTGIGGNNGSRANAQTPGTGGASTYTGTGTYGNAGGNGGTAGGTGY
ncbi:ESPR-type extended signal peptide-containing protein, partial [Acidithiobacillus ferrivorans]|uniref:ESPR-type extended signal peptide-containing protein n=1 Tax=Acidithiobacillus ferrivorans TaxID=160808 RepID=UPI001C06A9CC